MAASLPPDAGWLSPRGAGHGGRYGYFRQSGSARAHPVRRSAAAPGDRPGADAPAPGAVPRRADRGPGPGEQAGPVGLPAPGTGQIRHHGDPDHALPGGGGGRRLGVCAGRGEDHRAGPPGRGQGASAESRARTRRCRPSGPAPGTGVSGRPGQPGPGRREPAGRTASGPAERPQRAGHHRGGARGADQVPDRRAHAGGGLPGAARTGRDPGTGPIMSLPARTRPRTQVTRPPVTRPPVTGSRRELSGLLAIAQRDVTKLLRGRPRLAVNLAFPVLLIGGLGAILQPTVGRVTGLNAVTLAFTGVLAASLFQSAAAGMISIVEDRENDFSRELFVAPVSRLTLVGGKVAGETLVALAQGAFVVAFALAFGVRMSVVQFAALILPCLGCCLLGGAFGLATIAALP